MFANQAEFPLNIMTELASTKRDENVSEAESFLDALPELLGLCIVTGYYESHGD